MNNNNCGANIWSLTLDDMKKMSTKRLLNVKRHLHRNLVGSYWEDEYPYTDNEPPAEHPDVAVEELIGLVKSVLKTREHVTPNKRGSKS